MSPSVIVDRARSCGLNAIAITDHNSALNSPALRDICSEYDDITCLYGMEMNSIEEVHSLALFDDLQAVLDFSDCLYGLLVDIPNNPDRFGDQVYVNARNEILGECGKFLNGALSCTLEELLDETHKRDGLFIPAHIERPSYSIMSQLGFIPDYEYDALEQHNHFIREREIRGAVLHEGMYPCITSSDAHFPGDIGKGYIEFEAEELSIDEFRNALRGGKVRCFAG